MARVLIVERHDRTLRVLASTLGMIEYQLLAVEDGERLRLEVRDARPDVVVVNADLDAGAVLEGVADALSDAESLVPVVLYSRDRDDVALLEVTPPSVDIAAVLPAPLDPAELVRVVMGVTPPPDPKAAQQVLSSLDAESPNAVRRPREPSGVTDLARTSLVQLLAAVDHHDWSGLIELTTPSVEKLSLWFEMGQLSCFRSAEGKDLVETAILDGRLQRSAVPDVPLRHFEDEAGLLMALRAIGMHEVGQLERRAAVRLVGLACAARSGRTTSLPDEEPPFELSEPMAAVGLALDALRSRQQVAGAGLNAHPDAVLVIDLPEADVVRSWSLGAAEEAVLAQLRAARGKEVRYAQFQRVVDGVGAEAAEVLEPTLDLLKTMGYLRVTGRPLDGPASSQLAEIQAEMLRTAHGNPFEVLGLKPDSDDKAVKRALNELSNKHHPDRHFGAHPRVQAAANALYSCYREAYEQLMDAGKRKAVAEGLADVGTRSVRSNPDRARIFVRQGQSALRHKKYAEARQAFRDASLEDPDNIEAQVLRSWAWYLGEPAERRKSMNKLKRLVKDNRGSAVAWYYLARAHQLEQEPVKAGKYLRECLKIDPQHVEAQRELRLLERRGLSGTNPSPSSEGEGDGEDKAGVSGTWSFLSRLRGGG